MVMAASLASQWPREGGGGPGTTPGRANAQAGRPVIQANVARPQVSVGNGWLHTIVVLWYYPGASSSAVRATPSSSTALHPPPPPPVPHEHGALVPVPAFPSSPLARNGRSPPCAPQHVRSRPTPVAHDPLGGTGTFAEVGFRCAYLLPRTRLFFADRDMGLRLQGLHSSLPSPASVMQPADDAITTGCLGCDHVAIHRRCLGSPQKPMLRNRVNG